MTHCAVRRSVLNSCAIVGSATIDDVEQLCAETAESLGLALEFRQTNSEGEIVGWVQECRGRAAGIVINPAAFTHYSVAVRDAAAMCSAGGRVR